MKRRSRRRGGRCRGARRARRRWCRPASARRRRAGGSARKGAASRRAEASSNRRSRAGKRLRGEVERSRDAMLPCRDRCRGQPGDAGPGLRGEPQIRRGENPAARQLEGQPKGGIQRGETPTQRQIEGGQRPPQGAFQGRNPAAGQDDDQSQPKGAIQRDDRPAQRRFDGPGRGEPKEAERPPVADPALRKVEPREDPRREGDHGRSADPQRPDDTRRFQGKDERPQPGRPGIGGAPRVGDQGRSR